jgi:hypothetical protein
MGEEPETPEVPEVRRAPRAAGKPDKSTRARMIAVAILSVGAVAAAVGMWGPWRSEVVVEQERSASPIATDSTTTSVLTADGPVAPLTGEPIAQTDAGDLLRPALVAKIDAAAAAMPQEGLSEADVVVELRVEGISRYMAAWHSSAPTEIGPVRSTRTSDPALLALFGTPLFAFSGGNEATLQFLRETGRYVDVSHDAAGRAYRREQSRRAPHNLMADTQALWGIEADTATVPTPIFQYRAPGEAGTGTEGAGFKASAGSEVAWVWDANRRGWLRWLEDEAHLDVSGLQLAPTNVVVLETDYRQSRADSASPEAVSVGEGRAWLLSDGRIEEGTWSRPHEDEPWILRGADGSPMALEPGRTWVMLSVDAPVPLDDEAIGSLVEPVG